VVADKDLGIRQANRNSKIKYSKRENENKELEDYNTARPMIINKGKQTSTTCPRINTEKDMSEDIRYITYLHN
jgi:hypothetical protein